MTDTLRYSVEVTVEDGADIGEFESLLQDVLMDLYNDSSVEGVLVRDRTPPMDDDVEELLDVIESIRGPHVRYAIESVHALEDLDRNS